MVMIYMRRIQAGEICFDLRKCAHSFLMLSISLCAALHRSKKISIHISMFERDHQRDAFCDSNEVLQAVLPS